jgi:2-keto-4-pentenoate hydratase/2-oxohepta-3-ene-1,7-dioic acid hydratase in catechol pathway
MKLAVLAHGDGETVALHHDGRWIDFGRAYQDYRFLTEGEKIEPITKVETLLKQGLVSRERLSTVLQVLSAHHVADRYDIAGKPSFLMPLRPGKVIGIGRNYAAHAKELGNETPDEPLFFGKATSACIADGEAIRVRGEYGRVDHEGEIAAVIGRTATAITPESAKEYIAGYTLFNDVTAREMQKGDVAKGRPWFRGKSLDTFGPLGPVLLLRDAMPWPLVTDISLAVNGEIRQDGSTADFIFDLPTVLAYVTRYITLEPGDIIATGTPQGVSPLKAGDVVQVRNSLLGTLTNPVVSAD